MNARGWLFAEEGSTAAEWLTAIGTTAAAVIALAIAVWQHYSQQGVLRAAQKEKATLTAITGLGTDSVTIQNLGQAPVTRVRVVSVTAVLLRERIGPSGGEYAGLGAARVDPPEVDLLAPGDGKTFSFLDWRNEDEDSPVAQEMPRLEADVTYQYTDAAGARWERKGNRVPQYVGGQPLPGRTVAVLGERLRARARVMRSWPRKGFTKKSQARKRQERLERWRAGGDRPQ
ncbi:hypothetical protein [Streptomyces griseorubiginosus]|uniref:hypothetical protein n=1 Tax=Streptomyces griseorubiginosus TaxID=67304 RepID=UPI0036CFA6E3